MASNEQRVTCQFCGAEFAATLTRNFVGNPRCFCPSCRREIILPLSKGYRTAYKVVGVVFILLFILGMYEKLTEVVADVSQPPRRPGEFTLAGLRRGFTTKVFGSSSREPAPLPPAGIFDLVRYPVPLGSNAAYVSTVRPGAKRPGIVWIAGGFDWGLSDLFWTPQPRDNDQSAAALREAGIALMIPSLRGAHDNPGRNECFLGEVDDLISAAAELARRPDVDPDRIYLGGHSTGGTLALLTAESTARFRAVFAFAPASSPALYGDSGCIPHGIAEDELHRRAPIEFIEEITTPTFVITGGDDSAVECIPELQRYQGAAPVQYVVVPDTDHFDVLAPGTEAIARAILADTGPTPAIHLSDEMITAARRQR